MTDAPFIMQVILPVVPRLTDKERIKLVEEICSSIQEEGTITEIRNAVNRSGYDD